MSIELNNKCDGCRKELAEGDDAYCKDCYTSQEESITDLQVKIDTLESELCDLQSKYDDLKIILNSCSHCQAQVTVSIL